MSNEELEKNIQMYITECDGEISRSQVRPIPKSELIVDKEYDGICRNANFAVWKGEYFEYQRYKFGRTFTDKINHFEDDDGYDLFVPIEII